ncbi:hypothetical protein [Pseudooceanicola sp.]|nr:hypothetical protein [Pseudooceanicola sp.]
MGTLNFKSSHRPGRARSRRGLPKLIVGLALGGVALALLLIRSEPPL